MRKFALLGVTLLLGAAIVGASTYPQWGSLWRARAIAPLLVYSTESDAAYSGAINRTVGAPIASLSVGDSVAVVWGTYGKGYWGGFIRGPTGKGGGVLFTDLGQNPRAKGNQKPV